MLQAGPRFADVHLRMARDRDVETPLVGHRPGRFGLTDDLALLEELGVVRAVSADDDQHIPVVLPRTPDPVAVVPAQGPRQAEPAPEDVDRAGLAVVLPEHAAAAPLFGRQPRVG